jgi:hypothetical protein
MKCRDFREFEWSVLLIPGAGESIESVSDSRHSRNFNSMSRDSVDSRARASRGRVLKIDLTRTSTWHVLGDSLDLLS